MSEQVEEQRGTRPDAPNQQMVRPDGSGPAAEGNGGSTWPPEAAATARPDLDEMTKAELLDYAQQIGVTPANNNMSKEELRAGVDAKLEEG